MAEAGLSRRITLVLFPQRMKEAIPAASRVTPMLADLLARAHCRGPMVGQAQGSNCQGKR